MPILVVCPGCKTSFNVSEKFAGKKGPCPKCKASIQVPDLKEQVVIHAPEAATAPKSAGGKPIFKPTARVETKFTAVQFIVAAVVIVGSLVGAIFFRSSGGADSLIQALGALLIAPPVVFAGYAALRDQELEPHRGFGLLWRVLTVSAIYCVLWGAYCYLPGAFIEDFQFPMELFMIPIFAVPILVLGGLAAAIVFDLDALQAGVHYLIYIAASVLLLLIANPNTPLLRAAK